MSSPTPVDNFAKIVVIKRNGADGPSYPLTGKQCVIGRGTECDIRIQLPNVAYQHCRIDVEPDGRIFVANISNGNTTLNQTQVVTPLEVLHKDVLTIIDRSFRIELPEKRRTRSPSAESRRSAARSSTTPSRTPRNTSTSPRVSPRAMGSAKPVATVAASPIGLLSASEDFSPVLGSARASRRSSGVVRLARSVSPDAVLESYVADNSLACAASPLAAVSTSAKGTRKSLSAAVAATGAASKSPSPGRRRSAPAAAAAVAASPAVNAAHTVVETADQPLTNDVGRKSSRSPSSPRSPAASAAAAGERERGGRSPATDTERTGRLSPNAGGSRRVPHVPSPAVSASSARKPSRLRMSMASIRERSIDQRLVESPAATPTTPGDSSKAGASGSPAIAAQQEQRRRSGKRKSVDSVAVSAVTEADESTSFAAKRHRVSFGGQLSPELFDKKLPPATPLRRGATPRRLAVVESPATGLLKRRSLAAVSSIIVEESHRRSSRSPRRRSDGDAASPASSPAGSLATGVSSSEGAGDSATTDMVDSPVAGDVTSKRGKALVARAGGQGGSPSSTKHVVIKSPHVPHHEMSEEEKELERQMKAEEGAALLHHLEHVASPLPTELSTPPALGVTRLHPSPKRGSLSASVFDAVDSGAAGDAGATAVGTPEPRQSPSRSPRSPASSTVGSAELVSRRKSPASAAKASRAVSAASPHIAGNTAVYGVTPAGRRMAVASKVPMPMSPDVTKAVALRAIHGKQATPKLPADLAFAAATAASAVAITPTATPRRRKSGYVAAEVAGTTPAGRSRGRSAAADLPSAADMAASPLPSTANSDVEAVAAAATARRASSSRKSATLARRTWAEVVKSTRRKSLKAVVTLPVVRTNVMLPRKKIQKRQLGRPSAVAKPAQASSRRRSTYRSAAASTGHADSPMTIVITGGGRRNTPVAAKSTMPGSERTPYSDLPPTPAGPGEMIVSPVAQLTTLPSRDSSSRKSAARRSLGTTGDSASPAAAASSASEAPGIAIRSTDSAEIVEDAPATSHQPKRRSAASKGTRKSMSLSGVRELFAEPKPSRRSVSLTGVRELLAEAKPSRRSVSLTGVRELLAEPKPSRRSVSLTGVRELLAEPKPSRPSTDLTGIRQLMRIPKSAQESLSPSGMQRIFATPDARMPSPAAVASAVEQQPRQTRTRVAGAKRTRGSTDDMAAAVAVAAADLSPLGESADAAASRPTKRRKLAPETPVPAEVPIRIGTPASRPAGARQKATAAKVQRRLGGRNAAAAEGATNAADGVSADTVSSSEPVIGQATADLSAAAAAAEIPIPAVTESIADVTTAAAARATDASISGQKVRGESAAEAKKGGRRRAAAAPSSSGNPADTTAELSNSAPTATIAGAAGVRGRTRRAAEQRPQQTDGIGNGAIADEQQASAARGPAGARRVHAAASPKAPAADAGAKPEEEKKEMTAVPRSRRGRGAPAATVAEHEPALPAPREEVAAPPAAAASGRRKPARRGAAVVPTESSSEPAATASLTSAITEVVVVEANVSTTATAAAKPQPPVRRGRGRAIATAAEPVVPTADATAARGTVPVNNGESRPAAEEPSDITASAEPAATATKERRARSKRQEAAAATAVAAPALDVATVSTEGPSNGVDATSQQQPLRGDTRRGRAAKGTQAGVQRAATGSAVAAAAEQQTQPVAEPAAVAPVAARRPASRARAAAPPAEEAVAEKQRKAEESDRPPTSVVTARRRKAAATAAAEQAPATAATTRRGRNVQPALSEAEPATAAVCPAAEEKQVSETGLRGRGKAARSGSKAADSAASVKMATAASAAMPSDGGDGQAAAVPTAAAKSRGRGKGAALKAKGAGVVDAAIAATATDSEELTQPPAKGKRRQVTASDASPEVKKSLASAGTGRRARAAQLPPVATTSPAVRRVTRSRK